jgi:hypothetical protein
MKKNYTIVFAVIAALIVLCAFWSCSSSDDDDGPSLPQAEEASLGNVQITVADRVQVYKTDGSEYKPGSAVAVEPKSSNSISYTAAVAALSNIDANGKLTLKLPIFTYWSEINPTKFQNDGLTAVPPDVRTAEIRTLEITVSGTRFELYNNSTNGQSNARYIYADKDATIQGVEDDGDTIDLILKAGWNSVIKKNVSGSDWAIVTGKHGSGYRWEAEQQD